MQAPLPPTGANLQSTCVPFSSSSLLHQIGPSSSSSSPSSAASIKSIIATNRVRPLSINSGISGCKFLI